jgi:hypothetical protein
MWGECNFKIEYRSPSTYQFSIIPISKITNHNPTSDFYHRYKRTPNLRMKLTIPIFISILVALGTALPVTPLSHISRSRARPSTHPPVSIIWQDYSTHSKPNAENQVFTLPEPYHSLNGHLCVISVLLVSPTSISFSFGRSRSSVLLSAQSQLPL